MSSAEVVKRKRGRERQRKITPEEAPAYRQNYEEDPEVPEDRGDKKKNLTKKVDCDRVEMKTQRYF